jgi:hypothetical protein
VRVSCNECLWGSICSIGTILAITFGGLTVGAWAFDRPDILSDLPCAALISALMLAGTALLLAGRSYRVDGSVLSHWHWRRQVFSIDLGATRFDSSRRTMRAWGRPLYYVTGRAREVLRRLIERAAERGATPGAPGDRFGESLRRAADGDESAYHALLEAPPHLDALLESTLASDAPSALRRLLVELTWQRRHPNACRLLARALEDDSPEVWKEALDGLVTIGGPESREILTRRALRSDLDTERREWIREAIEQLGESEAER